MKTETIQNRYTLLRTLGSGAMGEVFLVEDRARGNRKVALKAIRPDLPNAGDLSDYFKTEFDSLRKLTHPNLASVYDFGYDEDRGQHFFTTEYVEGRDLLEASKTLTPGRLYDIVVQVCRALEYIHSHGIIHHDIKPQHILLGGNARSPIVKIIDFGLAREVQTRGGLPVRGTIAYLAPEVAKGGVIDIRADLYSLGATLFHVLSQRPPFEGENTIAIVKQHIEKAPRFPKRPGRRIPQPLGDITYRLLAKEPSDRYHSASEVIEAINKLAGKKFEVETAETRKSYVLSPKFVGRSREMERLGEKLRELESGELTRFIVLVSGEKGTGKSRLLREFRYQVQLSGTACFAGESVFAGGLGPFPDILRRIALHLGHDSAIVDEHAPYLVKLLPEIAEGRTVKEPPPLGAREEKIRLLDGLARFVLSASRGKRFVVFVEDIDAADGFSRDFAGYLAKAVALSREREKTVNLLLCLSFAGEENLPLGIMDPEYAERIALEDLTKPDVETLIGSMIPLRGGAKTLAGKVFSVTGGNPLFVEEVAKGLVEEGAVMAHKGGWRIDLQKVAIPKNLSLAVSRRLSHLPKEALTVLRAVTAFDRPVSARLIAAVTDVSDLSQALSSLRKSRLTVRKRGAYAPAQPHVGQALLLRMHKKSLKALHDGIGAALEKAHGKKAGKHVEEIAFHYLRGSVGKKAVQFGMQAAREFEKRYANESAIDCYERVRSFLAKGKTGERLNVSRKLGEALELVGKFEEAAGIYKALLRLKGLTRIEKAEIWKKIGDVCFYKGQYDKALRACTRALEFHELRKPTELLAGIHNAIGAIKEREGAFESAEEHFRKGLEIRKSLGDRIGVGDSLNNLGLVLFSSGNLEEAEKHYQRSLRLYKSARSEGRVGTSLLNLSVLSRKRGRLAKASRYASQSLTIQEKTGDKQRAAICRVNLGAIYALKREYDVALEHLEEARRDLVEMGSSLELDCLINIGHVYLEAGDYAGAKKSLQSLKDRGEDLPVSLDVRLHFGLGEACLRLGEPEEAEDHLLHARDESVRIGEKSLGLASSLLLAELRLATGFKRRCRDLCEEALEEAEKTGDYLTQASAYLMLGKCDAAKSQWQGAASHLASSLKAARKTRVPELIQSASFELGLACQELGKEEKARKHFDLALKSIKAVAAKLEGRFKALYLSDPLRDVILKCEGGAESALVGTPVHSPGHSSRLLAIGRQINSELDMDKLLELIIDTAVEVSGAQRGFLVLADGGRLKFEVSRRAEKATIERPEREISRSVIDRVMSEGRPVLSTNAQEDELLMGAGSIVDLKLRSILCIPFRVKGRAIGCVYLDNPYEEKAFSDEDQGQLEFLADQAAIAIENARLYREVIIDSLTNMYTHRYFDTRLKEEIGRARRYGRKVSMLMIDVDKFKSINDTYGHETGNEVLRQVSGIIRENTRDRIDLMKRWSEGEGETLVGRYGGDEFEVLLPETDSAGARVVALRALRKVRENTFLDGTGRKKFLVTLSIGVATFPDDADDEQSLFIRADEALYNAKRAGRNRVVAFGDKEIKAEP